jgi:hypothetical protein
MERTGSFRESSPNSAPSPASSDSSDDRHLALNRADAARGSASLHPTSNPPRLHPMLPLDLRRMQLSAILGGRFPTNRSSAVESSNSTISARSYRSPRRANKQRAWLTDRSHSLDPDDDQAYLSFVARPHAKSQRRFFAAPPPRPTPAPADAARWDRLRPPSDLASYMVNSRPVSGHRPGSGYGGGGGDRGGTPHGHEEVSADNMRLGTPKEISRVRTPPALALAAAYRRRRCAQKSRMGAALLAAHTHHERNVHCAVPRSVPTRPAALCPHPPSPRNHLLPH